MPTRSRGGIMPADEVRRAGRRTPGRWLLLPLRRARLSVLLVWRQHRPPRKEREARDEQRADRRRLSAERRLAAEAYHWALVGEGRRPTPGQRAAGMGAAPVAKRAPPELPEA